MDLEIALLLAQDGLANGAIYVLMAIGIVLIFNVTRVAFVPFGDLAAYAALTLGAFQLDQMPGTIWLVLTLAGMAFVVEAWVLIRRGQMERLPRAFLMYCILPALPVVATLLLFSETMPMALQIGLTVALVLPIGPLLYRLVFQPIANASILTLLMVAVALHFALTGLALLYFGPEGLRTEPYTQGAIDVAGTSVSTQTLLIIGTAIVFSLALYVFFDRTITGKALRATAINRVGARLMGIRTSNAGALSFLLATGIAIVAGILISPVTTIYYDTGFLVGLKGFVGSVVGGFVSYPLAAVGALLIGMIEAYASFYASSLKDAIVFAAIIPVVIWRWLATHQHDEAEEEEETQS